MKKHDLKNGSWYMVQDFKGEKVKAQYVQHQWPDGEIYEQFNVEGGGRLPVWAIVGCSSKLDELSVEETAVYINPDKLK